MTRRQRLLVKRSIRNLTVVILMILAFLSGFFGHTLLNARAEEEPLVPQNRYYTSIQLKAGDSLWKIADRYADKSRYSTAEYMQELKEINGLKSEAIHSGEFLTVFYYGE